MKICHIQTRLLNGGADENTTLSCNHQVNSGHEVLLIYGNESHPEIIGKIDSRVKRIQCADLRRAINPWNDWKAYCSLGRLLKEFKPDIIHTHTSKAGILGRLAARRNGFLNIVHGVHILPFLNVGVIQKYLFIALERMVAPATKVFICVSESLKDENVKHGIAPDSKHVVIPSGMNLERFKNALTADAAKLLPERFKQSNPRYIVYVGALEPRKRQLEFLDVFAEVVTSIPDAILLYVGSGHSQPLLENAIRSKDLGSKACILGFRDDVEEILKLADLCILASEREGLARVLIQYCLAGKPIVTTALPGTEQIVEEGENGHIVPVNQLSAMAVPIIEILANPGKQQAYSDYSRNKDLSRWSEASMARSIDQVYQSILSN